MKNLFLCIPLFGVLNAIHGQFRDTKTNQIKVDNLHEKIISNDYLLIFNGNINDKLYEY